MSEMVERLAQEIQLEFTDTINGISIDKAREVARAAIAAMREPTEAMIEASHQMHIARVKQFGSIHYASNYQAMIDEALK